LEQSSRFLARNSGVAVSSGGKQFEIFYYSQISLFWMLSQHDDLNFKNETDFFLQIFRFYDSTATSKNPL